MAKVIRAEYRAMRSEVPSETIATAMGSILKKKHEAGELLRGSVFRRGIDLFLYLELLVDDDKVIPGSTDPSGIVTLSRVEGLTELADSWFGDIAFMFREHSGLGEQHRWLYMHPVFWHDLADEAGDWMEGRAGAEPLGKVAVLNSEKLASYVFHHQDITAEGLLKGPRTKFISLFGRVLFMCQDLVDERPEVNVRRNDEPSKALERWEAAGSAGHFVDLTGIPGKAFKEMETLAYV